MTAIGLWRSATTAFLVGLTACLINIRFGTSKFCQMPIWNIKTAHRRNLLGTVITIPTVITLLPTLGLQAELWAELWVELRVELRAEPSQSFVRRFVQRFCRAPCTSPPELRSAEVSQSFTAPGRRRACSSIRASTTAFRSVQDRYVA